MHSVSLLSEWTLSRDGMPSAKSPLCIVSFDVIITPHGKCYCFNREMEVQHHSAGKRWHWTDAQCCLASVPATVTCLATATSPLPQVPRLRPLLQPGGVSQQAPGPCGQRPGGCANEARGWGWIPPGGLFHSFTGPGTAGGTLSWRWHHFLLQPRHRSAHRRFGEGGPGAGRNGPKH